MHIVIPNEPIPAFDCLEIINGFICLTCKALYDTEVIMTRHYRIMKNIDYKYDS